MTAAECRRSGSCGCSWRWRCRPHERIEDGADCAGGGAPTYAECRLRSLSFLAILPPEPGPLSGAVTTTLSSEAVSALPPPPRVSHEEEMQKESSQLWCFRPLGRCVRRDLTVGESPRLSKSRAPSFNLSPLHCACKSVLGVVIV